MAINALNLVTENLNTELVNNIINSIEGNDVYYVFAGHSVLWPNNDSSIIQPVNSKEQILVDCYQNMIFGKQLTSNGIMIEIPRYDWVANTIFTMYNDMDGNLYNENFYCVVNAVSQYYVYKCLYNNNDSPSLVAPNIADTGAQDASIQTSDGYVWKYLYTVDETLFNNFSTPNFMPLIQDANVAGNTIDGAIDIVVVQPDPITGALLGGSGYNNYLDDNFISSDIQVGGNNVIYGLSNNASSVNGYYSDCILYIIDGAGQGQFRQISNYRVNGTVKEAIINAAFTVLPDATSHYQVSPIVNIYGDENVTVNCEARALINAFSSNSVYSIDILNRGAGYRIASANISSDVSVGVSNNASLQVIIPPKGGHGFDVQSELGGSILGITVKFSNSESNTITTQNSYRQIGLIKNPSYANVELDITDSNGNPGSNGNFLLNEIVYEIIPLWLTGSVVTVLGNNQVTSNGASFVGSVDVGDFVYITNLNAFYISTITGVNSSVLTLTSNVLFNSGIANIAIAQIVSSGIIQNKFTTESLNISDVVNPIQTNTFLIGANSFATANVSSFKISGITKPFTTYSQLYRYEGTLNSGTFTNSELIFQANVSLANASFHSINTSSNGTTTLYATDQDGAFVTGSQIIGSNSGAIFSVTTKYSGDLMVDTGQILYIENRSAIPRSDQQSEIINIALEL